MADIYVRRRCAVVSRTSLVFSWTGLGGGGGDMGTSSDARLFSWFDLNGR